MPGFLSFFFFHKKHIGTHSQKSNFQPCHSHHTSSPAGFLSSLPGKLLPTQEVWYMEMELQPMPTPQQLRPLPPQTLS